MSDLDYVLDTPFKELVERDGGQVFSVERLHKAHPYLTNDPRLRGINISRFGEKSEGVVYSLIQFHEIKISTKISSAYPSHISLSATSFPVYRNGELTYYTRKHDIDVPNLRELYDSLEVIREEMLPSIWLVQDYFSETNWREIYMNIMSHKPGDKLFTEMVNHFHFINNSPDNFKDLLKARIHDRL